MTTETSPELHSESASTIRQHVRDNYPVDLIFNRHADGADALKGVEYVQDNSVVFIEGTNPGGLTLPLSRTLEELFIIELQQGRDSATYASKKQAILELSQREKYRPAQHAGDFSQHKFTQIEALLQKDCTVLFADYSADYTADMPVYDTDLGHQVEITPEFVAANGLAKSYITLQNRLIDDTITHYRRETHAATLMYKYLALMAQQDPANTQGREVVGIYGSAHADSLVDNIDGANLVAISSHIQLDDAIEPYNYLPSPGDLGTSLPRRIALTALQNATQFEQSIAKDKSLINEVVQSNEAAHLYTILALQFLGSIGSWRETRDEADLQRAIALQTTLAPKSPYARITEL